MYIHKTEEHCLSHLIYVQHIQWMSTTGRFQEHSYAMFLELLAMDCSLFIKKGCYQHIRHVLSDLSPHWVQEQWVTTALDTLSAIITCIQSCTCFSSSQLFCWMICFQCNTLWHVPFSAFSAKLDVNPTLKKTYWDKMIRKINFQCFQTMEGGVWVEHNIIQGVRETAGDHPDTRLHLNILQCVMLPENSLLKMSCFSAMCVTHLACEKAACLSIVCFLCIYVSIWSLFLYQYLIIGCVLFSMIYYKHFCFPFCWKFKKCFSNCWYHLTPW